MIMLQSNLTKQPTKAEMEKKAEAWKTLNSVLVKANSEFMNKIKSMLVQKQEVHKALQEKLESQTATEEDNAEYLYLGGYIQCLKDLLGVKGQQ